jgi:hypothetical protein
MNTSNKMIALITGFLMIFSTAVFVSGQDKGMDRNRLNRDLKIMEGILDKLFHEKSSYRQLDGDTRGLYLDGFGILFHAGQDAFGHTRLVLSDVFEDSQVLLESIAEKSDNKGNISVRVLPEKKEVKEDGEESVIVDAPKRAYAAREKSNEKILEEEKKAIDRMKENIHIFFKNYSSAIGQLRPTDRIAILVDLKDWTITNTHKGFLTAWTAEQDIQRFRNNEINDTEFGKRTHFNISNGDTDISNDIDIMTEILERGMDTFTSGQRISNNGIYLEGLGALFFVELPGFLVFSSDENASVVAIQEYSKALGYLYRTKEKEESEKSDTKKDMDEWIKKLKEDLFELVSSYGHTLRLKPQESIILNVDLGHRFTFWQSEKRQPSNFILYLKKADVDNYNRGGISLAELRKKAVFQTI